MRKISALCYGLLAAALLVFILGVPASAVVYGWSTVPGVGLVTNTPVVVYAGLTSGAGLNVAQSTVAALPACSSSLKGVMREVTDATSPSYLGTLTGAGAVFTPVVCNGTAWVSF